GVDFWHAVEFSRNGRFLRTHPLGLSSGRFPSVFPTLPDSFSVPFPVRIQFPVAVGGPLPFGCSDFIRIISADLIGVCDSDENRIGSVEINSDRSERDSS
ncbi:hypothetical protein ACGF5F_22560, partial [Streptomyces sp. NPDC047821]|uniref:hypothetical protein n=1 Tax=Streptomyces sp. NPDC047821 TaxID=3365488 RepID=UPI00371C8114